MAANGSHLPGLQGLRGVAALAILVFHTAYVPRPALPMPWLLGWIVPHLWVGVTLFFILSAFLLLQANHALADRPGWLAGYAIRRYFRIAPLFYAMLAFYAWEYPAPTLTAWTAIANLLFVFNPLPGPHVSLVWAGWTMGVEMPFYALFPLVLYHVRGIGTATVLLVVTAVLAIGSRAALFRLVPDQPSFALLALPSNLVIFAAGICAWHVGQQWSPRRFTTWWLPASAVSGLILLAVLFPVARPDEPPSMADGRPDLLLWVAPLALVCLWQAIAPSRVLAGRTMQWVGARSFSCYLLHPLVIWVTWENGGYAAIGRALGPFIGAWSFVVSAAATVAITLVLSTATYALIELPGQSAGRWCSARLQRARATVKSAANTLRYPVP